MCGCEAVYTNMCRQFLAFRVIRLCLGLLLFGLVFLLSKAFVFVDFASAIHAAGVADVATGDSLVFDRFVWVVSGAVALCLFRIMVVSRVGHYICSQY